MWWACSLLQVIDSKRKPFSWTCIWPDTPVWYEAHCWDKCPFFFLYFLSLTFLNNVKNPRGWNLLTTPIRHLIRTDTEISHDFSPTCLWFMTKTRVFRMESIASNILQSLVHSWHLDSMFVVLKYKHSLENRKNFILNYTTPS